MRIAGVEIPDQLKIDYALTRIKGIGWSRSENILDSLKIDRNKRVSEITKDELTNIISKLEEVKIEGELLREVRGNIQRLRDIGSYRGMRHARGLPVRGQRTRTNARTKRGKRRTVGSFKKEMLSKIQQAKKVEEKR